MTSQERIENFNNLNYLLEQKYNLLKDMLDITELQLSAIIKEELTELEELAEEKQLRINSIDRLDDKFNTVFSQLKKQLGFVSFDELHQLNMPEEKRLKENTNNIIDIINKIVNLEKENNEKMLKLMSNYKNELKNITFGKKAVSIYNNPYSTNNPSFFIDKKK